MALLFCWKNLDICHCHSFGCAIVGVMAFQAPLSAHSRSFPTVPSLFRVLLTSSAMSRLGSSATHSGGSGASRMVQEALPESSSRLHLEECPFGEATGLPLIPCPDCGLARVVERRLMNETSKDHLRVFFKCPLNVSGFPKLCGFYKFQREYLDKLKDLDIVRIRTSPALEIDDEATEEGDATSGYTEREMKAEANKDAKESKLDAKMEELLWKSNLLMFVFAVLLGGVVMYLVVAAK